MERPVASSRRSRQPRGYEAPLSQPGLAVVPCIAFLLASDLSAAICSRILLPSRGVTLRLGRSSFAQEGAYRHSRSWLSAADRELYFSEGYLVLRDVVPPETVLALRRELLRDHVLDSFFFEANTWLESEALLDFIMTSHLGRFAAELSSNNAVHLLHTAVHFRGSQRRIQYYHIDHQEFCGRFVASSDISCARVKLYLSLFNNMPAFWLLNQSSLEAFLLQEANETILSLFRTAGLPWPPRNLCYSPECEQRTPIPSLGSDYMDMVSVKPVLNIGDVIVHSTTLPHRSAPAPDDTPIGWLAVTFALPDSPPLRMGGIERECAGNFGGSRLLDVPRPDCYPRVYPPTTAGELHLPRRSQSCSTCLKHALQYRVGRGAMASVYGPGFVDEPRAPVTEAAA